jgi:pimeloyl-ACP methyl ester carboxylesterase
MNIQLNYKTKGSGKPIIILHGLFGMLDNWNSIGSKLAEHFAVYLVDQRDHGRSDKSTEFGYELLAHDLKLFCDKLGLGKVGLIGHSMGGKTAMAFANAHPDLVDKVMVVDIAPKEYAGGHESIFEAILNVPIENITKRSEVNDHLSAKITNLGVRQFLMKNLTRKKEGGFEWKANFQLLNDSYESIKGMIDLKVGNEQEIIFIKGEKSDYILPEDESTIKELYTNAKFETIADAGHWVHAENPKALLDSIYSFFQ